MLVVQNYLWDPTVSRLPVQIPSHLGYGAQVGLFYNQQSSHAHFCDNLLRKKLYRMQHHLYKTA